MKYLIAISITLMSWAISAQDIAYAESDLIDDAHIQVMSTMHKGEIVSIAIDHNQGIRIDKGIIQSDWNQPRYYSFVNNRNSMYIMRMDEDLNVLGQHPFKIKDTDNINLLGLESQNGNLYLYYTTRKSFDDFAEVSVLIIDDIKWKRHKTKSLQKIIRKKGMPITRMVQSPNKKYSAIISVPHHNNNEEFGFYIAVLGEDGNLAWKDKVSLGRTFIQIALQDAAIDNAGNVYVSYHDFPKSFELWTHKNKNGEKEPSYTAKIISYGMDESEIVLSINNENNYLRKCNMTFDSISGDMQIIGTYSIKDKGNVSGIYHASINIETFENPVASYTPFSKFLIEEMDQDGIAQTKDKDPGIEWRNMREDLLINHQGKLFYILQPYDFRQSNNISTGINRTMSTRWTSLIKSPIICSYDQGEVAFHRLPRKINESAHIESLYAKSVLDGDYLHLIYSDSHKNMKRELSEKAAYSGHPTRENLVSATLSPDGTLTRNFILDKDEEDFRLSLQDIHCISPKLWQYSNFRGGLFKRKRKVGILEFGDFSK